MYIGGGVVDQRIEQWAQVGSRPARSAVAVPGLGIGVEDREVELRGARAKVDEQLVDRVEDLRRARIATVDLVDRDDDGQAARKRLCRT